MVDVEDADRAFAARLQQEEDDAEAAGGGGAGGAAAPLLGYQPVAAAPQRDEGPAGRGGLMEDPGRAVRNNVVTHLLRWGSRRTQLHFGTCLNVPQIIAGGVVLAMYWNEGGGLCDTTLLKLWVMVHMGRLLVDYLLRIATVSPASERGVWKSVFETAFLLMRYISLTWVIVGLWWVFLRDSCSVTAHSLYTLTLALVLFNLFLWVLPWLLILLALPFIFCCLPQFISLLAAIEQGASEDAIRTLSSSKYRTGMFGGDESDARCAICLDNYTDGDDIRVLPCQPVRHHFHLNCLDRWLRGQNTCPMCRRDVFEGMNHDDDDDMAVRAPPQSRRVNPPPAAAAAGGPVVAAAPAAVVDVRGDVAVGPNLALHDGDEELDDGRGEGQQ